MKRTGPTLDTDCMQYSIP